MPRRPAAKKVTRVSAIPHLTVQIEAASYGKELLFTYFGQQWVVTAAKTGKVEAAFPKRGTVPGWVQDHAEDFATAVAAQLAGDLPAFRDATERLAARIAHRAA